MGFIQGIKFKYSRKYAETASSKILLRPRSELCAQSASQPCGFQWAYGLHGFQRFVLGSNLPPLLNEGYSKQIIMLILKYMDGIFPNIKKGGLCSKHLEKIPLAPPRPEEGVCFRNMLKTDPYFESIWKKGPFIFF